MSGLKGYIQIGICFTQNFLMIAHDLAIMNTPHLAYINFSIFEQKPQLIQHIKHLITVIASTLFSDNDSDR